MTTDDNTYLRHGVMLKALPLLEMTGNERRLLDFVLTNGIKRRWVNYQSHDLAGVLALHLGANRARVGTTLASLRKRGWLAIDLDHNVHHVLTIGRQLHIDANRALCRRTVRAACGEQLWADLYGDDELADAIWNQVTLGLPFDILKKAPADLTPLDLERLSISQRNYVMKGAGSPLSSLSHRQALRKEAQRILKTGQRQYAKRVRLVRDPHTGRMRNAYEKVVPIRTKRK